MVLKKLATRIFNRMLKKSFRDKSYYIFYRIINFREKDNSYLLQCINTSKAIYIPLSEIVSDVYLLYGLYPAQACYIGIKYATYMKKMNNSINQQSSSSSKFSFFRYGSYTIHYSDRKQNICFSNVKTNEEFMMDPRDIAFSEHLIEEFDAIQAFHIGLLAGLKMHSKENKSILSKEADRGYLSLVKG